MNPQLTPEQLNDYQAYLQMLARVQLRQQYQAKVGASDIVQQTLLRAVQGLDQFRGSSEAELRGWLRQILAHELAHLHRDMHRDKRDVRREQAIQQQLDQSSMRLEKLLVADVASPSRQVIGRERMIGISVAMEELPEMQREAVRMRYMEDLSVNEIAEKLDRSVPAVAGLLHRGLKALRERMASDNDELA